MVTGSRQENNIRTTRQAVKTHFKLEFHVEGDNIGLGMNTESKVFIHRIHKPKIKMDWACRFKILFCYYGIYSINAILKIIRRY